MDLGQDIEHKNPLDHKLSLNSVSDFKHSSLELEPEKEFENSKWIVLTTPHPFLSDSDKDGQVDQESTEKLEKKSSNKDQNQLGAAQTSDKI